MIASCALAVAARALAVAARALAVASCALAVAARAPAVAARAPAVAARALAVAARALAVASCAPVVASCAPVVAWRALAVAARAPFGLRYNTSMFYLGCAVWAYKDWVGELFPPGSRSTDFLRLYSRRLTTVEGNTTFYALPSPAMVARWVAETPESFRFCLKLPRAISHEGPLTNQFAATEVFLNRVAPLGPRLGPCFLQLPPGYGPAHRGDLARWLAAWPQEYQLTVEARHPDWYEPAGEAMLMEVLERYGVGRVVMDVRPIRQPDEPDIEAVLGARNRKPVVPMHPLHSAGVAFIRYIGHPDLARNAVWLDEWAARIAAWLAQGLTIYLFMHCPDEARSPGLCRAIQQRLAALGAVPPLPWETADQDEPPAQLSLF